MSYSRDFTIGLRETQDFHLSLVLHRWRKGLLGFGAAAALVVWMYLSRLAPDAPAAAAGAAALLAGAVTAAVGALWLVVSTVLRVRGRVRRSGRESYVQSMRIDGFGIHVAVGENKAKLPFDRLLRVQETRKAFYLFIAENQAWLLPKAQMEDREGECAQIRQLLRTVVERGKLHLKK